MNLELITKVLIFNYMRNTTTLKGRQRGKSQRSHPSPFVPLDSSRWSWRSSLLPPARRKLLHCFGLNFSSFPLYQQGYVCGLLSVMEAEPSHPPLEWGSLCSLQDSQSLMPWFSFLLGHFPFSDFFKLLWIVNYLCFNFYLRREGDLLILDMGSQLRCDSFSLKPLIFLYPPAPGHPCSI